MPLLRNRLALMGYSSAGVPSELLIIPEGLV